MTNRLWAVVGVLAISSGFLLITPESAEAARVRGYTKKSGTYVQPHYRSNPNAFKDDNYGYSGGSRYNSSYSAPTKNYSSKWYTPSTITQPDYSTGLNSYRSRRSSDSDSSYGSSLRSLSLPSYSSGSSRNSYSLPSSSSRLFDSYSSDDWDY